MRIVPTRREIPFSPSPHYKVSHFCSKNTRWCIFINNKEGYSSIPKISFYIFCISLYFWWLCFIGICIYKYGYNITIIFRRSLNSIKKSTRIVCETRSAKIKKPDKYLDAGNVNWILRIILAQIYRFSLYCNGKKREK